METKCVRKPEHKNGWVFIWKIKNYSMCALPRNGYIESPKFMIPVQLDEIRIKLYPWNKINVNCIGIGIENVCGDHKTSVEIFILTNKGYQDLCKETCVFNLANIHYKHFENLTHGDIVKEDSIFLSEDTLTLRFHFSNKSILNESLILYSALSEFEIQRLVFHLTFNRIDKNSVGKSMCRVVASPSLQMPQLNVTLNFTNLDNNSRTFFHLTKDNSRSFYTVKIKISVVCTDGNLRYISKNYKSFAAQGQSWYVWNKFSLNQLLKEKELCLQNGIFTLQCELIFSTGAIRSHLEECDFVPNFSENKHVEFRQRQPHTTESDSNIPEVLDEGLVSLRNDLRYLLSEQKLCDAVVRASGREFPIHKAILCARSPVFSSMFELDMKEKRSGVVHIDDVDSETVEMFLNYLYTGSVNNLKLDTGMSLYSAADKYQVSVLKKECLSFLLSELSEGNVCDILILSDLHQDNGLKQAAQEVFCAHSKNVLLSKEWINLIQKLPNLAAEVLQVMATKM